MIGVWLDPRRAEELGVRAERLYRPVSRLNKYMEGVVPFLWVPKASPGEEVVDIYGRRRLFAFNNSGCLASPGILERSLKALRRAADMGYDAFMLDAVRYPSPVDGLLFYTTCFCPHSFASQPDAADLYNRAKQTVLGRDVDALLGILEELSRFRAVQVEAFLRRFSEEAERLDVELMAAVFPYPLSRYLGQHPRVLREYLDEVHVMLYHRCGGAACLNAEISYLLSSLQVLGFTRLEALELLPRITGLRLREEEAHRLGQGLGREHLLSLMEKNAEIYGGKFVPIVQLDMYVEEKERLEPRYGSVDLFPA